MVGVWVRPGCLKFLEKMSQMFEIVIYTASTSDYANPIIDYIDKDRMFVKFRLFREHCTNINGK